MAQKKTFKTYIIFGKVLTRSYDNYGVKGLKTHLDDGEIKLREFSTEEERRAYLNGLEDAMGWEEWALVEDKDVTKVQNIIK